jgi:hypothetical protein
MPPPTCTCGTCPLCTGRYKSYRDKTPEEKDAWLARRNPEKVRAADRARYERDKEKRRAAMDAYQQTPEGRAAHVAATTRWRTEHPEAQAAHNAVARAIRSGKLVKGPCEVGVDCTGQVHAHHEDYSKRLEVRWLCARHHRELSNTNP